MMIVDWVSPDHLIRFYCEVAPRRAALDSSHGEPKMGQWRRFLNSSVEMDKCKHSNW
jgi:hypothetical protein